MEINLDKKELFYTLENVQVDCRELTKDQVKEMCDIYENKGYYLAIHAKENEEEACILSYNNITQDGEYGFYKYDEQENNEYTITYEKFMELFDNKLPPYKEVPLKWNYETLVGDNQVVIKHTKEFSPSKKQVLKYLLKRDIILTPKQYKKL